MMTPTPAMSNAERQRQFRERHPGYHARIQARKRAMAKRDGEMFLAKLRAEAMAKPVVVADPSIAQGALREPPAAMQMLALPAPVVTIEIPGMTVFAPPSAQQNAPLAEEIERIAA